jgi:transposase InsO family protein
METLAELHPAIQYAVRKLSDPLLTFEQLGSERGISKQAVEKQCKKGLSYLRAYQPGWAGARETAATTEPATGCTDRACRRDKELVRLLQQRLVIAGVKTQLLKFFREQVLKFFPRFKVARLPACEKKQILDWCAKFRQFGGLLKDFAAEVGRSPETLSRWQEAYDKHGLSGLTDKKARPKHFGNKIPLWVRDQLVLLFLRFPRWTPYQYHSYVRHNPTTQWYVSLPVIQKLKNIHIVRTAEEKERIAKRWCFAPGTDAWTVDFTCLLKTPNFKLQCLTISDHRSRFLLHSALYLNTSTESIIRDLEELFVKYGKPLMIKADNGPEFRIECRDALASLAVYLLNSPEYYGQFNGAHERIHRTMKAFIDPFETHQNITRLVAEIAAFQDEYNYKMPMDSLDGKTPADIFMGDGSFTPKGAEVVTPYEKEGELRMKFTSRSGAPARMAMPAIEPGPAPHTPEAPSEPSQ